MWEYRKEWKEKDRLCQESFELVLSKKKKNSERLLSIFNAGFDILYLSKEIIWNSLFLDCIHFLFRSWVEFQVINPHMLINFHNSCLISASVAVIWSREDSNNVFIVSFSISLVMNRKKVPPFKVDALSLFLWDYWYGWTVLRFLIQKRSLLLLENVSIPRCYQDRTIISRTLVLLGVFLRLYLIFLCCQEYPN